MVKKLLLLFLLASSSAFSQRIAPYDLFSYNIEQHLKSYVQKADLAYEFADFERGEFLFDSLVKNVVNRSYMDNFKAKKLSGREVEFYDFEKPMFLMTYAAWCTPGVGEIPALNKMAETYHDQLDIVILFWNSKKQAKAVASEYSSKITLLYIDEVENKSCHAISTLKHSLGFPTSFFIKANKQIVDVRRGVLHPYNEEYAISYELNHEAFLNGISLLLTSKEEDASTLIGQN
ncbi:MAG: redoxin domain-containing protein [Gilvibacter sp.]